MMTSTQIIPFVPVSVDLDYPHLPSMANDYQRWKKFMLLRNVLPPKRLIYLDTRAAQKIEGCYDFKPTIADISFSLSSLIEINKS